MKKAGSEGAGASHHPHRHPQTMLEQTSGAPADRLNEQ